MHSILKGDDLNEKCNGWTPMHCAVENNKIECLNLLINNSADVNLKEDDEGWTPLHFAAMDNH